MENTDSITSGAETQTVEALETLRSSTQNLAEYTAQATESDTVHEQEEHSGEAHTSLIECHKK